MSRPGGPHSQQRPPQQYRHQHGQHSHGQPAHGQRAPQHQPFSAAEARGLLLDLAGAGAAATLMLVLTCWLLSLGGAFAPGHVEPAGANNVANDAATGAAAAHH